MTPRDHDAGYWSHEDRRTGTSVRRESWSLLRPGASGLRCWNSPGAASYSWQTGWLDHACSGHLQLVPPSLYHGYFAMEPLVGGMLALEGDRRKHAGWLSAVNGAARRAGAMARFRVG